MDEELQVKKGLVAQAGIDITLAEKALKVAEASHKTARSLVAEVRASRKRSSASLARWKSEAARMEKMSRERVIDTQSRDETLHQYRAAEAALAEADARIASAEAAEAEGLARCDKAEADVAAARNRLLVAASEERRLAALLRYADLTAPFDGVVSQRNVHTGHFLQPAAGPAGKAEPVFEVVRMDKVRIFLEVPEADAVLVKCGTKEGCPAKIRVPVLNDREFAGRVSGTSWSLEPSQRTLRTEIDFDNPQGLLRPGMYAHALIEAEQPDAWTLPAGALLTRDGQTCCYLLEDGKAVRTAVRSGAREGGDVEVLKKQRRPARPGDRLRWVDFDGAEAILIGRVDELIDGQSVSAGTR
jgi:multidrug efflux pump subunit AcrA (membrane-fusion protein)